MTPEQFELVLAAARLLLAHRDAGRHCDPESIKWAESLLAQNPAQAQRAAERIVS